MEKLNKVPIKHSDEIVANNTDKTFEELELQAAEGTVVGILNEVKTMYDSQLYFRLQLNLYKYSGGSGDLQQTNHEPRRLYRLHRPRKLQYQVSHHHAACY